MPGIVPGIAELINPSVLFAGVLGILREHPEPRRVDCLFPRLHWIPGGNVGVLERPLRDPKPSSGKAV